jgi:hypothetical protein
MPYDKKYSKKSEEICFKQENLVTTIEQDIYSWIIEYISARFEYDGYDYSYAINSIYESLQDDIITYYNLLLNIDRKYYDKDNLVLECTFTVILSILSYLLNKIKLPFRCSQDDFNSIKDGMRQIKISQDYSKRFEKITNINLYMQMLNNLLKLYYMSIDIYDYPKYEQVDYSRYKQIDINILIELLEYKNTNYSIYSYALLKKIIEYINDELMKIISKENPLVKLTKDNKLHYLKQISQNKYHQEMFDYVLSENPRFNYVIYLSYKNYMINKMLVT